MTNTEQNGRHPTPLFRQEAITAQSAPAFGAIRLNQPLSSMLIVSVAVALGIAMLALLYFGSLEKKVRVSGVIMPRSGVTTLVAPNAGVVTQIMATEGTAIKRSDALFTISTGREGAKGELSALLARQVEEKQANLDMERRSFITQQNLKQRAIEVRLANLQSEARQLQEEVELTQERRRLVVASLEQMQALQKSGYISPMQIQKKQEEVLDVKARVNQLQRQQTQLESSRLELEAERTEIANAMAAGNAQFGRTAAGLAQELVETQNRGGSLVVAPVDGQLSTLATQTGQAVAAGQVLGTLVPAQGTDALEAHLYIPSRSVGFVAKGQKVLLRYQAFPYQKFGLHEGTVADISTTPFAPNELPPTMATTILSNVQSGAGYQEALYRVRVRLHSPSIQAYGKRVLLKPGMTLDADVVQDRRYLWEWIAEPLIAIAVR